MVIEDGRHLAQLRRWATVTEGTDARGSSCSCLTLGGRPCAATCCPGVDRTLSAHPRCPSPWGATGSSERPRALSDTEITEIIGRFARAARIAANTGFDGVQIHAAHGYLIMQFLSPLVNDRTDRYGGSLENRMRLLIETVREIRATTSSRFLIAVKLNSADFQRGGFDADDSLTVAHALEKEGIDLLEISGGTYESTAMVTGTPQRESTRAREAYFLEFAERFSQELSVPVMPDLADSAPGRCMNYRRT